MSWGRRKDTNKPYKKTGKKGIGGSGKKTQPTGDVHYAQNPDIDKSDIKRFILTGSSKKERTTKSEIEEVLDDNAKITNIEDFGRGFKIETDDGSEYVYYEKESDAEKDALEQLKDMFESDTGTWEGADWVNQFLKISDTDKRIIANEEADSRLDGISWSELRELAKQYGVETEDDKGEDLDEDEIKDKLSSEISDEIEKELDNPVKYFVDDQGMYSLKDLAKQNFIMQDYEAMARYVIDNDGVAPTLAGYDHDERNTKSGAVVYRMN